ncbi:MAG: hypothetical protein KIC71_06175 [Campylobacter concisus]|nr:hypothetical protein [Campylobacter concisus]
MLEFCVCDMSMLSRPVCNRCLAKDVANVRILTATKRVNLYFLANLLSKKPHKFTQNSQI